MNPPHNLPGVGMGARTLFSYAPRSKPSGGTTKGGVPPPWSGVFSLIAALIVRVGE